MKNNLDDRSFSFGESIAAVKMNPSYFFQIEDMLILNRFSEIGKLPEYIWANGNIYKRFLEIFYLNTLISELTRVQKYILFILRLRYLRNITNMDYNQFIICELIKRLVVTIEPEKTDKPNILDYGIGSGISLDCMRHLKIDDQFKLVGTDICTDALKTSGEKGIKTFKWDLSDNIKSNCYDGIISSFVFDFNITLPEIKKLYRILKPGRRLVLNMYKKDIPNVERVKKNLITAGFDINCERLIVDNIGADVDHKYEKIIIAEKL
ncbi:hypothetical protein JW960_20145 [candidate division KSB1 bacterium]|nr:hypothetical protein [candidate division KSB1 bacterium]